MLSCEFQCPLPGLRVRYSGVRDPEPHVVTLSPTYGKEDGKESLTADLIELFLYSVEHMGADPVDVASMPGMDRECVQPVEVFMAPTHEQDRRGLLLWEIPVTEPPEVSVTITCYEYHLSYSLS